MSENRIPLETRRELALSLLNCSDDTQAQAMVADLPRNLAEVMLAFRTASIEADEDNGLIAGRVLPKKLVVEALEQQWGPFVALEVWILERLIGLLNNLERALPQEDLASGPATFTLSGRRTDAFCVLAGTLSGTPGAFFDSVTINELGEHTMPRAKALRLSRMIQMFAEIARQGLDPEFADPPVGAA